MTMVILFVVVLAQIILFQIISALANRSILVEEVSQVTGPVPESVTKHSRIAPMVRIGIGDPGRTTPHPGVFRFTGGVGDRWNLPLSSTGRRYFFNFAVHPEPQKKPESLHPPRRGTGGDPAAILPRRQDRSRIAPRRPGRQKCARSNRQRRGPDLVHIRLVHPCRPRDHVRHLPQKNRENLKPDAGADGFLESVGEEAITWRLLDLKT